MQKLLMLFFTILCLLPHVSLAASPGEILITEILIEGENSKDEFIKIHNTTETSISLENWKLYKKTTSGNSSNLVSSFPKIEINPHQTFLIVSQTYLGEEVPDITFSTKNSISKNNALVLEDENETIIDKVSWGENFHGFGNSAQNPLAKEVLSRIKENESFINTQNNRTDFEIITPTVVEEIIEINPEEPIPGSNIISNAVLINEIQKGKESWIELYNNTNTHLSLVGCGIRTGKKFFVIPNQKFIARGYLLINDLEENFFQATEEKISLLCKNIVIDTVSYNEQPKPKSALYGSSGNSLARKIEGLTGNENHNLFVETIIKTPGKTNALKLPTLPFVIKPNSKKALDEKHELKNETPQEFIKSVKISELFPNPKGKDNNEWIELYNSANKDISLENWILEDAQGKKYTLNETIKKNNFLLIEKERSKINLNNNEDNIKLFTPLKILVDEVLYSNIKESNSYALSETGNWKETSTATPGEKNIFESEAPKKTNFVKTVSSKTLSVKGLVSASPHQIKKDTIFLEPEGYEIALKKEAFPDLSIGDEVQVEGKESSAKRKINLTSSENIEIIKEGKNLVPHELKINEIAPSFENRLVLVKGVVIEKNKSTLLVEDEGESIVVNFKQLLKTPYSQEGDFIEATGLLFPYKNSWELILRNTEDFKRLIPKEEEKNEPLVKKEVNPSKLNLKPIIYLLVLANLLFLLFFLQKKSNILRK